MSFRWVKATLKTGIVIVAILVCGISKTHAQGFTGVIDGIGSVLRVVGITDLYNYAKTRDTTYYVSPKGDFDICLNMNLFGSRLSTYGSETVKHSKFRSHISSENEVNSSIIVGYKGIAFGYTFNPFSKTKKGGDHRFNLTLNGNFLGINFAYHNVKSFSGYSRLGTERYNIPYGEPNMKLFLINTYVVFNHKHYSFPAGVSQSYIQKRSSGSLIAGVTYTNNRTNVSSIGFGEPSIKINAKMVSIGAGYGYNYVPWKDMLLAFSFIPKIVVYDSSFINVKSYDISQAFKRPQLTYYASLAMVKWFGNFFVAVSALADGYTSHKTSSGYHLLQTQWQTHFHLGVNF